MTESRAAGDTSTPLIFTASRGLIWRRDKRTGGEIDALRPSSVLDIGRHLHLPPIYVEKNSVALRRAMSMASCSLTARPPANTLTMCFYAMVSLPGL